MSGTAPERSEDPIEAEGLPVAEAAPSAEPQAEPDAEAAAEEALEYIEDPAIDEDLEDELEVSPDTGAMGEDESTAAGDAAEGLELAEVPEDIWGDGNAEQAPRFDEPPPAAGDGGRASPSAVEPPAVEEPLLGEPTARLLEYLKGLADELPPEKKEEFDVSGFKRKVDDLIGKIQAGGRVVARAPSRPAPRERLRPPLGGSGHARLGSPARRGGSARPPRASGREGQTRAGGEAKPGRAPRERRPARG